ncbi:hypothetical protein HDK90DRAFT_222817 [Phyllosticta capitalensis]|uniref:Uncharacterized protein n=1 Tax=Phyllosticta capitalensis TaxID=121624 RepID=A0ABR1YTV5_9PEZI
MLWKRVAVDVVTVDVEPQGLRFSRHAIHASRLFHGGLHISLPLFDCRVARPSGLVARSTWNRLSPCFQQRLLGLGRQPLAYVLAKAFAYQFHYLPRFRVHRNREVGPLDSVLDPSLSVLDPALGIFWFSVGIFVHVPTTSMFWNDRGHGQNTRVFVDCSAQLPRTSLCKVTALVYGARLVFLMDSREEFVSQSPAVDSEAQGLKVWVGAALARGVYVEVRGRVLLLVVVRLVVLLGGSAVVVMMRGVVRVDYILQRRVWRRRHVLKRRRDVWGMRLRVGSRCPWGSHGQRI